MESFQETGISARGDVVIDILRINQSALFSNHFFLSAEAREIRNRRDKIILLHGSEQMLEERISVKKEGFDNHPRFARCDLIIKDRRKPWILYDNNRLRIAVAHAPHAFEKGFHLVLSECIFEGLFGFPKRLRLFRR